jgi:hypothetical protein
VTRTPTHTRAAALLALLGFVVVAWWPALPSRADCVTPTLSVTPGQGPPGTPVTISGSNWYEGCYDPNSPTATAQGFPPPRPDSDIHITFSDGRSTFEVARVTPAGNGGFSFQAQVPDGAQPGFGSFKGDGTNGSPAAGFSVGAKTPPATQPPTPTTKAASSTATTAKSSGSVAGSSSGTGSASGSSSSASGSSVDFGAVTPNVPKTPTTVFFNPTTPLAPLAPQAAAGQYFATSGTPGIVQSSPPVTLASSGGGGGSWLLWVIGFLAVGVVVAVGYFIYQRNQRNQSYHRSRRVGRAPNWRPRGF